MENPRKPDTEKPKKNIKNVKTNERTDLFYPWRRLNSKNSYNQKLKKTIGRTILQRLFLENYRQEISLLILSGLIRTQLIDSLIQKFSDET